MLSENETEKSMKKGLTLNHVSRQLLGMRCIGEKGSVTFGFQEALKVMCTM